MRIKSLVEVAAVVAASCGTLGCRVGLGTQFRFDNGDTAIGKRTHGSFLAAFLGGKSVTVYLDGRTSQGVPGIACFSLVS